MSYFSSSKRLILPRMSSDRGGVGGRVQQHLLNVAATTARESTIGGIPKTKFIKLVEEGTALMRWTCKPKVISISAGRILVSIEPRNDLCSDVGHSYIHNAVVSSAMDNIAGFCAWSTLDAVHRVSTVDLDIHYLQKIPMEKIFLTASVYNKNDRIIRVSAKCLNHDKTLTVANVNASFNVYYGKAKLGTVAKQFFGLDQF